MLGIAQEFEDQSRGTVSVMIAGMAQEHIPVDTGHMRKNTMAVKKGNRYYLITNTKYAAKQYMMNLYHLYDGQYRSISKAGNVPSFTKEELGGYFGADVHKYVYWRNYEYLRGKGLLVKRKGEWFHRAAAIVLDPAKHALRKQLTTLARKHARKGNYYNR